MAWTVEYTDTAKGQLRKIDRTAARRIMDYMDRRVGSGDPRRTGRMLTGHLGKLWRYRVGDSRVICDLRDESLRVLVVTVAASVSAWCRV